MTDAARVERHGRWMRLFALSFFGATVLAIVGTAMSPVARQIGRGERVTVLLFGVDAADLSHHTDTLMLAVLDPNDNYLAVLNIPRDTHVNVPGYRFRRVNEIYGYHNRRTGDRRQSADRVREGIQYLLSTASAPVSVPYYVQVDFSGFRHMVDLLGGVEVNIKTPMHYDDNAGNLHIHFDPGRYVLSGDDALKFVRFRGATGDRGRIYRQQEFVRSMLKRLANPMMVFRLPQITAAIVSSIETNLRLSDLMALGLAGRRLRSDNVGFYILPGRPVGALWMPNRAMAADLAALMIAGTPPPDDTPEIAPQSSKITIHVWNASGQPGLAYQVTRYLRRAGYDVIDYGNYAVEQPNTRVIDRNGRIGDARTVAETLGVDSYHSDPTRKALVDVEVVLGQNFAGLKLDAP